MTHSDHCYAVVKMVTPRRRYWSAEEDKRLRHMVACLSDKRGKEGQWDKISQYIGTRTAKECRARWFQCLHPNLRRGKWTREEDEKLKDAFRRLGPAWARIAEEVPGRTDDQCSKRFNDVLSPTVQQRLRPWSDSEDKLLLDLFDKYGPKWQQISQAMNARTGLTCRNRWRKLNMEKSKGVSKFAPTGLEGDQILLHDFPEFDLGSAPGLPQFDFLGSLEEPELSPEEHTYSVALETPDSSPGGAVAAAISGHDVERLANIASANNQKIVINHYINVGPNNYFVGSEDPSIPLRYSDDAI